MIYGHVRDYFPRVTLKLPGHEEELSVEFMVDTAFEGDLALPQSIVDRLDASYKTARPVAMADGSIQRQPFYELYLMWNDEPRLTEVAVLENNPLLGAVLMNNCLLQAEMMDGGEVTIEPL